MFNPGPPPTRLTQWTIGMIVAGLMLLAACDPRRASGDRRSESSLPATSLWSPE